MQQQLTIIEGPEAGRVFALTNGQTLSIGRGQMSDTQVNDPRLSRVHCQVQVESDRVLLTDHGSSGGTFVGGQQITDRVLRPGDVIQMGDTKMQYEIEGIQGQSTMVGTAFGRPKPPSQVPQLQDLVGQSFAHYRLDSIITKGQSGMVFKACDTKEDRVVAVKVLAAEYCDSEEEKQRFVRAMKTMLPIHHVNIVRLFAAGKPLSWAGHSTLTQ